MHIGVMIGSSAAGGTATLNGLIGEVQALADQGMAGAWTSQLFDWDALTALGVIGSQVPNIALGTAVVPTYPRHPLVLASQAMTVQAATQNRLTLGIGLSHQIVIEGMFGYSFAKPARHMREYLSALMPLLRGEAVDYHGETLTAAGRVRVPGTTAPSVLVAALGPAMLKLTAELADGTVTWMTGPATLGNHIVPAITAGAAAAGRPEPRVVAALPVCVTAAVDTARDVAAQTFAIYGQLPSYRAMLDREGAAGPADVAIIGSESEVAEAVRRVADAGVTEFVAAPFGTADEITRTLTTLAGLVADGTASAASSMRLDG
ncbi:MAG: TIGR03564 family F420-dependent LLM class oxidoreductase [Acidimicrobiales bacterium]